MNTWVINLWINVKNAIHISQYDFTILNISHTIIYFQKCHIERFHEDVKWLLYNSDHFYNLGSSENIGEKSPLCYSYKKKQQKPRR